MHNASGVGTVGILIPHACWTEDGAGRNEAGESAVEKWTHEKTVYLKVWVLQKHGQIPRDWRINTQDRLYYWG